jgi:hypothetical protein
MKYMGDHPVVGYVVNAARRVNAATTAIEKSPRRVDPGLLFWVVAVVLCPLCGARHEHPMARAAGWGWFSAPCAAAQTAGYYLCNDPPPGSRRLGTGVGSSRKRR